MVDACLLVVGARVQRARGDEVAPQPAALVAHPVAEHDVLAHGEAHEQLELLERAGEAEAGPLRRRRARDLLAGEEHLARPAGGAGPDSTPKSVVLPAPLGPTSPTIVAGGTDRLTSLRATRPPKRTVTSAGFERGRRRVDGRPLGRLRGAHDPATSAVVPSGCDGRATAVSSSWCEPRIVASGEARSPRAPAGRRRPTPCAACAGSPSPAGARCPRGSSRARWHRDRRAGSGASDHGASSLSTVWMNAGEKVKRSRASSAAMLERTPKVTSTASQTRPSEGGVVERDRLLERERVEPATDAGHEGGEARHQHLHLDHAQAHRARRVLAPADRVEREAGGRPPQVHDQDREDREHREPEVDEALVGVGELGAGDGDAGAEVGEVLQVEHEALHEEAERERDQRDVEVAEPDRQEADDHADRRRDQAAHEDGGEDRPPVLGGELRRCRARRRRRR